MLTRWGIVVRLVRAWIVVAVLGLVACSEQGFGELDAPEPLPPLQPHVYAHDATTLYGVDLLTERVLALGGFHVTDGPGPLAIEDIALHPDGPLYAVSARALYEVDPTSAELTWICDVTGRELVALTATARGDLYAASMWGVYRLDPGDCRSPHELGSLGGYETTGDLVGPPDGRLFWLAFQGEALDHLMRIEGEDASYVDDLPGGHRGLSWFDDALWGFRFDGEVLRIDPDTGLVHAGFTTSVAWRGAASWRELPRDFLPVAP